MIILSKFFKKIDNLNENAEFSFELYLWNRTIKQLCKKYHISEVFQNFFLETRKNVLTWVNRPESKYSIKLSRSSESLFIPSIANRVFELNDEFPVVVKMGFFHSADAITRQIIELYIRTLYCRYNPSYIKILFEKPNERFPGAGKMKEIVKNSEMNLPYLKQIISLLNKKQFTREEFLDGIYSDFEYFSEMHHSSSQSFASNIWIVDRDINKKVKSVHFHIEDPEKIKNKDMGLLIFVKRSHVPIEHIEMMIRQFFFYSTLILAELSLINEKNIKSTTTT